MLEPLDAIYEKGVLKLKRRMRIADGTAVRVIVVTPGRSFDAKLAAAALEKIAGKPVERDDAGFSGQDHDQILYGEPS